MELKKMSDWGVVLQPCRAYGAGMGRNATERKRPAGRRKRKRKNHWNMASIRQIGTEIRFLNPPGFMASS
jgi:hypothetical protein